MSLQDLKVENKIKMKLLTDWEKTRHGQIKFITENKEKQLLVTAENFKKDSYREIRLKHEIECKLIDFNPCCRGIFFLLIFSVT